MSEEEKLEFEDQEKEQPTARSHPRDVRQETIVERPLLPRKGIKITRTRGAIPQKEYRIPILEVLLEKGGKATLGEILEIIEQKMGRDFNQLDIEILRDGYTKRWQKNVAFARFGMSREGLLKPDSPRGIWEISKKGKKYFENNS